MGDKRDGNSESDIVNVAIKQLTPRIRDRLMKLFDEGLLKDNDLDLRAITVFASLNEGLQDRVMTHLENDRIYLANARSKSGFLIATCDKAKTGCLDARGLGAIDPWRSALVAMATPKPYIHNLQPERDWMEKNPDPVSFVVNVAVAKDAGEEKITVVLGLGDTGAAVKSKLAARIASIPVNQMKLEAESCGFIKDSRTLAYYNLKDGDKMELSVRKRGGARFRRDHAVPLKRPKIVDRQPPQPKAEPAALPALPALPGLPGLPGLPAMPKPGSLPGLPGLPAMPKPGSLPGLPGLPAMPKPGGMPGFPGLPGLPGMPGMPGMPAGMPAGMNPSLLALTAGAGKAPGMPGMPGMPAGMNPMLAAMMAKAPGMPGMPGAAPPSIDPSVLAKLGLPGLPAGMAPVGATPKGGMAS